MTTQVTLNPYECKIARYVGKMRRQADRHNELQDQLCTTSTTDDPYDTDAQAFAAEMAVAKYLNLYPDFNPSSHKPYELVLNGHKIDVKHTKLQTGNLLIHTLHVDLLYILVRGEMPRLSICGYVRGEDVNELGAYIERNNHYWLVECRLLRNIDELSQSERGET